MIRFVMMLSLFTLLTPNIYAATPCEEHQCIAVVDAGSTGSRAHIYAYDLDETNTPINIIEVWTKKVKPGFANIEPNANTIDAYLTTLFAGATEHEMPVYFYATAGMRLLPAAKQKVYYQELKRWFNNQKHFQLKDAKTITGNEEALFDWLSVNEHLDALRNPEKSIGVMDMGGASVQIVFPIAADDERVDKQSQVKISLYGHSLNLYVHSFLGLGQTEVTHQFLNSNACFSYDYLLPNGTLGQGNAPSCEQEVASLINGVHSVNKIIQPVLTANPVNSWYVIGGLTNLADSELFHFENKQLTSQSLLEQADNAVCHQSWNKLEAEHPENDFLYGYCLFSAYYYALLVDGYGIYPEEPVNYIPANQNVDWTKGVVLYH